MERLGGCKSSAGGCICGDLGAGTRWRAYKDTLSKSILRDAAFEILERTVCS